MGFATLIPSCTCPSQGRVRSTTSPGAANGRVVAPVVLLKLTALLETRSQIACPSRAPSRDESATSAVKTTRTRALGGRAIDGSSPRWFSLG